MYMSVRRGTLLAASVMGLLLLAGQGCPSQMPSALPLEDAVLAGSTSPLLEYNKADFDAAFASDKLVVLYFYANWCPICRLEFPKMQKAFDELSGGDVVGFRVNFNDSETTPDEKALARVHGVAYQHTKVFLKDGERVFKSPESWDRDRYLLEINRHR